MLSDGIIHRDKKDLLSGKNTLKRMGIQCGREISQLLCNSALHFIYKPPHGLDVGYFSSAASLSLIGGDF